MPTGGGVGGLRDTGWTMRSTWNIKNSRQRVAFSCSQAAGGLGAPSAAPTAWVRQDPRRAVTRRQER